MQSMFGASVSELYLLIKSLINIGRAVDKEKTQRTQKLWVRLGYDIQACCTQAGAAHAAGRGGGIDRWQHSSYLLLHALPVASFALLEKRLESSGFDTATVSQATKTNGMDRLPYGYVYRSSHW